MPEPRIPNLSSLGLRRGGNSFWIERYLCNSPSQNTHSQPIYGLQTILPVLVSFLMTSAHWYATEKDSKRIKTLPLLLAQIWPQYRTARVLWLYKNNNKKWMNEKKHIEMQLSFVGKLVC